ncbi:MAG: sulfatase-like hydrolase/transferase [Planctomycetes bacterium]|nr:sulfatase-like hydrolase/transferase [Planctomycetota bacterium]
MKSIEKTNFTRRDFLKTLSLGAAALAVPGCVSAANRGNSRAHRHPNIVFVMADDMGYGDLGCYNTESKIPTPNIDRLAKQGIRFTDAHSPSAVCTPTRYGVLTGRYCWRTWLKSGVVGGYTNPLIEPGRTTVASFLQKYGYRTACIGKWHLGLGWTRHNGYVGNAEDGRKYFNGSWQDGDPEKGMNVDFTKPVSGGPADLGFDYAYFTAACSTIDGPFCYIQNRNTVGIPNKIMPIDKSVHADYRPRPGWVADGFDVTEVDTVFTGKAIEFMENNCKEHPASPFFLYLPLSSPHAPWLPPDFVKGRSGDGARGDLVAWTDWCVGQILDALDRLDLAENTLLIVTSDNGPRHGLDDHHKSSGKLRGYKSHIWEGGHRVPFLARWPGKIEPGSTSDEVICLTDLITTSAAVVGAKLPDAAGPDSFNILPALLGAELDEPIRPAIVHHSVFGVFSIRQGKWKLILDTKTSGGWVRPSGKKPVPGTPGQLYNLRDDPNEQNDLWGKYPEITERLTKLLEKYKLQGHSRY